MASATSDPGAWFPGSQDPPPEPAPIIVRHGDRRQAPRRAEEVALHYAREALVLAALECHDDIHLRFRGKDVDSLGQLDTAAAAYRKAVQAAAR